jgi:hypothetical protein
MGCWRCCFESSAGSEYVQVFVQKLLKVIATYTPLSKQEEQEA